MEFVPVLKQTLTHKLVRQYMLVALVMVFLLANLIVAFASDITLDVDVSTLFTQINTFIPVGFAIFAVPVGILVAFTLVRFIANALLKAFQGREL